MSAELQVFEDPIVRLEDGVAVVNSRDVARHFDKQHKNVLRDIDNLLKSLISSNLSHGRHNYFREILTENPAVQGREDRSYDMTRDGFTLLVLRWTGERALRFQVKYMDAFNAMEAKLRERCGPVSTEQLISAVREIVSPITVRFDHQAVSIDRVERRVDDVAVKVDVVTSKVDSIASKVIFLETAVNSRRRKISYKTRIVHVNDVAAFAGRCPCCSQTEVVVDGKQHVESEFDHFYQNSHADESHTWLICKSCHLGLTTGKISRPSRTVQFDAYQANRRRLRPNLFDLF